MKPFLLSMCLLLFLLKGFLANAQRPYYFNLSAGAGGTFFKTVTEPLQVSFPYSATDASGNTTQQVFTSKEIKPYSKPQFAFNMVNIEVGFSNNFIAGRVNVFSSGVNFSLGYGRIFYFDIGDRGSVPEEKFFVFKPSLSIDYGSYRDAFGGDRTDFGTIDNEDKTLNILGYTAGPEYSYYQHHPKKKVTVPVKTMEVIFNQRDWEIMPKISISNNPYKNRLHLGMDICYYIPVSEKGGIQLSQNDDNHLKNSPRVIGFDTPGLNATLGGSKITSTPYSFRALYVGVTVGMNITDLTWPDKWFK